MVTSTLFHLNERNRCSDNACGRCSRSLSFCNLNRPEKSFEGLATPPPSPGKRGLKHIYFEIFFFCEYSGKFTFKTETVKDNAGF